MATSTRSPRATPATRRPASTGSATLPRVHLYQFDARVVLAKLPARSISVVLTDPPYRTVNRSGTSGHLQRWFAASLSWRQIGETLALARSRMRPDGVAFVMTNDEGLHDAIEALEHAGFVRHRQITWDKQAPGLGGGLRHQTETVLVGYLPGSRTLTGVDLVSVPAVGPGTAGRYPTEKPEGLGRALARMAVGVEGGVATGVGQALQLVAVGRADQAEVGVGVPPTDLEGIPDIGQARAKPVLEVELLVAGVRPGDEDARGYRLDAALEAVCDVHLGRIAGGSLREAAFELGDGAVIRGGLAAQGEANLVLDDHGKDREERLDLLGGERDGLLGVGHWLYARGPPALRAPGMGPSEM